MYAPPIVGKHVEDTQHDDQKGGRPLGFKADGNHGACGEAKESEEYTSYAPFSLKNEAQEQEDEQNASGK